MKRTFDFLLREFFGAILRRMDALEAQGVRLMATVQELSDKLDSIGTAIAEERIEVQALLEGLRAEIQALQDQIGGGQLVTQEQLDALAASADSIVTRVREISEPVPVE